MLYALQKITNKFVIVNQDLQEIRILVVMYWIYVKQHLVDQELGVITQEVLSNVYVHLELWEIRTKTVVIHQLNVKSTKTAPQQHIVFKLMVFPSVKITVKK